MSNSVLAQQGTRLDDLFTLYLQQLVVVILNSSSSPSNSMCFTKVYSFLRVNVNKLICVKTDVLHFAEDLLSVSLKETLISITERKVTKNRGLSLKVVK